MTGKSEVDEIAALRASGLTKTPEGYTWHHHQDGKTMMLVEKYVHEKSGHTGGVAVVKYLAAVASAVSETASSMTLEDVAEILDPIEVTKMGGGALYGKGGLYPTYEDFLKSQDYLDQQNPCATPGQ